MTERSGGMQVRNTAVETIDVLQKINSKLLFIAFFVYLVFLGLLLLVVSMFAAVTPDLHHVRYTLDPTTTTTVAR